MKKKSRFLLFILSFMPGLSHLYAGFRDRAVIFFLLFFGAIFGVAGVGFLVRNDGLFVVLGFALPLIWFLALVDVMSLTSKAETPAETGETPAAPLGLAAMDNRRLITIALSIVPGAGHMYLGMMKDGVRLMTVFFFAAFLMGWLNMSLFLFVLPVIWFYSLFDAYHRVNQTEWDLDDSGLPLFSWAVTRPKLVGWGLIILGGLVIFQRIITPLLNWEIRNYIQTGLVALILIASGIKVLLGTRQNPEVSEEEEAVSCEKEE